MSLASQPVKETVFEALQKCVQGGWTVELEALLRQTAGVVGDLEELGAAQSELASALVAEGVFGHGRAWTKEWARTDKGFDREAAARDMANAFVAAWMRRRPCGEREPINAILRGASVDPSSVQATTLKAMLSGVSLDSAEAVEVLGDLAFQHQQHVKTWVVYMLSLEVHPQRIAHYLLGAPALVGNELKQGGEVLSKAFVMQGHSGYLMDLERRLDLLWASGLFLSPEEVVECVAAALNDHAPAGVGSSFTSCFNQAHANRWLKTQRPLAGAREVAFHQSSPWLSPW